MMTTRIILALCCSASMAWGKLSPEQQAQLPPPADTKVDFKRDIQPIFEESCINCHGRGKSKGGFVLDTREMFLKGGDTGPAAIPGKSAESLVIEMVSGLDPDIIMPQKGTKLTTEQVSIFRAWIDQGLPWDESVAFGKLPPKNLHPRNPEVPSISGVENPIDRFIWRDFEKANFTPEASVDDRIYARRVYLDVIGLLPTPGELDRFVDDSSPDKRAKLVEELLARDFDYAVHWLTFWNDALRNDYKGTGYIDGGRKQITSWLFSALAGNKPYNHFVAELVNPTPESEGFAKGIVWRGVVNASQTPQMQAAQNISQVFLGVNLKCASCHDSFINDWRLADAYGLASVYADSPLEMFECDKPTGETALMQFLYPELGTIDASAPKPERLNQLAGIVTSERNGRLTRTIVNRLWERFMGRGLIEPVDEMDHPAWNQDLLDWLASDLAEHEYNLKHTIARMLTSRAYQLPAVPVAEQQESDYVFRGPTVRRMSAEQFIDSIAQVTEVWNREPAAKISFASLSGKDAENDSEKPKANARWIWSTPNAAKKADASTIYLRRFVDLPAEPTEASFIIACDNTFTLYINGREVASGKDHTQPSVIDVRQELRQGINLIAVAARNWAGAPANPEADQANPAGFWFYGRVRAETPRGITRVMDFASDRQWLWNIAQENGWQRPAFPAAGWQAAAELGDSNAAPWKLGPVLADSVAGAAMLLQTRAALANNDPLMTALGRPNREQVVTSRASAASTLQALELTNGSTLAEQIKKAGEKIASNSSSPGDLVRMLYQKAYGRNPSDDELALCTELVGQPARAEGVEDLLWSITMLPEFQLIY